jgi:hypothetical protein
MTPDVTTIFFLVIKSMVVFGLGLYMIFAFVILRQQQLMAHVLEDSFEPVLRLLTLLHIAAAIVVFILAILLL